MLTELVHQEGGKNKLGNFTPQKGRKKVSSLNFGYTTLEGGEKTFTSEPLNF